MPATSQDQQKFMNFVHAVQKGEASGKGYPKVEEAAKEMKPKSVEHFMGRGHIDKSLPKQASEAFINGFIKRAGDFRLTLSDGMTSEQLDAQIKQLAAKLNQHPAISGTTQALASGTNHLLSGTSHLLGHH